MIYIYYLITRFCAADNCMHIEVHAHESTASTQNNNSMNIQKPPEMCVYRKLYSFGSLCLLNLIDLFVCAFSF